MTRQLTAWNELVTVAQTLAWLGGMERTVEQLQAYLRQRLAGVWKPCWQKAATKKRVGAPTPTQYLKGGHSSVYRILRGQHKLSPDPATGAKKRC